MLRSLSKSAYQVHATYSTLGILLYLLIVASSYLSALLHTLFSQTKFATFSNPHSGFEADSYPAPFSSFFILPPPLLLFLHPLINTPESIPQCINPPETPACKASMGLKITGTTTRDFGLSSRMTWDRASPRILHLWRKDQTRGLYAVLAGWDDSCA